MTIKELLRCFAVIFVFILSFSSVSGTQSSGIKEVEIKLSEFKIESSQNIFYKGVPYRFVIENIGNIVHDWVVMPPIKKHQYHGKEHRHMNVLLKVGADELPPGATVIREFTFSESGNFEFSCHLPGHYESGMMLPIVVK